MYADIILTDGSSIQNELISSTDINAKEGVDFEVSDENHNNFSATEALIKDMKQCLVSNV